jgi:hypothetical protein
MSSRFPVPREFHRPHLVLDSLNVTRASQKCKANFGKSASWGRVVVDRRAGRDCAAIWIELGWMRDI